MSTPQESTPAATAGTPTGVQAAPPGPPAVKLPPQPRPDVTPEELSRGAARLDGALVAVVLVLAFLLGSFAVRNSDFWMHLATGRAMATREYLPWSGHDPFAYTTADTYWTNHNWLYDLEVYTTYRALGEQIAGPALVVLKALLVVALAVVLLRTRRSGQSLWVPAACTGLALLAMSPRLYLQPVVFSFLFLGLTLWYLECAAREPGADEKGRRPVGLWWLPLLFVLWANTDGWFLVGLVAVALYVAGEALQARLSPGGAAPGSVRRLGLVLGLSAAACLLNPSLYHVFLDWPAELSFMRPIPLLAQDNEFRGIFLSPFDRLYWQNASFGASVAGLAFFPLVLLGILSFAVNRRGWRWSRALTWLAFFGLAAWRLPAVPFFAVVAGPITALNFQDAVALRRREEGEPARESLGWGAIIRAAVLAGLLVTVLKLLTVPEVWLRLRMPDYPTQLAFPAVPWTFLVFAAVVLALFFYALGAVLPVFDRAVTHWSLGGRLLTVLAGLALVVAAWPGWLQASSFDPYRARHVAWSLEPDASYKQVGEFLGRLRQQGTLRDDDRGFSVTPQVMNYCAWYCPEEKGFFDMRFTLFPATAQAFVDLRDALRVPEKTDSNAPAPRVWPADGKAAGRLREAFRQAHVTHVVIGDRDAAHEAVRVEPLLNAGEEWVLLYRDGRTAVFGWQYPAAKGAAARPWESLACDSDRLAFGAVPVPDRAPETGPPPPASLPALTRFLEGSAPRSLDLDQAEFDHRLFAGMRDLYRQRRLAAWTIGYAGGMVGSAAPTGGPVAGPALLGYRVCLGGVYLPPPEGTEPPSATPLQGVSWVAEQLARDYFFHQDSGPPACAILSVRAARAAVAETPRDPNAYLVLEQAYRDLHAGTQERSWSAQLPALDFLRQVQAVTALSRALELDPDLAPAHAALVQRYAGFTQYGQQGFLDLALRHQRELLRILKNGHAPQESAADYKHDVQALEKTVSQLQQAVTDKQNQYEVRSAKMPVLQKAQLALSLGLAEQALNVLLESEVLLFGPEGARLELELLLCTGRTRDVRRMLFDPSVDLTKDLGQTTIGPYTQVPAFEWYQLARAAAEGDYGKVDEAFETIRKAAGRRAEPEARARLAQVVAGSLMNMPPLLTLYSRLQAEEMRTNALQELAVTAMAFQEEAELLVYRGLFALEAGDTQRARDCFRRATAVGYAPSRAAAEHYLSLMDRAAAPRH